MSSEDGEEEFTPDDVRKDDKVAWKIMKLFLQRQAPQVPGFLKSEGSLSDGGPVWRVELASPLWPKVDSSR
jgi:hypothetical protein